MEVRCATVTLMTLKIIQTESNCRFDNTAYPIDKKPFAWVVLPLHYVLKWWAGVVSIHPRLRKKFTVSLLKPSALPTLEKLVSDKK